jgi:hypothetical protein
MVSMRFALGTLAIGLVVVAVVLLSDPLAMLIAVPLLLLVVVLFAGALALERTANDDS